MSNSFWLVSSAKADCLVIRVLDDACPPVPDELAFFPSDPTPTLPGCFSFDGGEATPDFGTGSFGFPVCPFLDGGSVGAAGGFVLLETVIDPGFPGLHSSMVSSSFFFKLFQPSTALATCSVISFASSSFSLLAFRSTDFLASAREVILRPPILDSSLCVWLRVSP